MRKFLNILYNFLLLIHNFYIYSIENHEANAVRIRHTGVLGLCAFISAYPYDVPDFVPNVFEHLGAHLNDPQPIPVSCLFFEISNK